MAKRKNNQVFRIEGIPYSKAPSKNSLMFIVNDADFNVERKKFLKKVVLPKGPCVSFEYFGSITPEEVVKYSRKFKCYFIDDFLNRQNNLTELDKVLKFVSAVYKLDKTLTPIFFQGHTPNNYLRDLQLKQLQTLTDCLDEFKKYEKIWKKIVLPNAIILPEFGFYRKHLEEVREKINTTIPKSVLKNKYV